MRTKAAKKGGHSPSEPCRQFRFCQPARLQIWAQRQPLASLAAELRTFRKSGSSHRFQFRIVRSAIFLLMKGCL
jgi:hypothetical protein